MTQKLYLPILLDVVDVISTLKQTLPESDSVDMGLVVKAMLERIFYNVNPQFGHLQGPFGAYRQQAPQVLKMDDFNIDLIIHEAEIQLMDHISSVIPSLTLNMTDHYFNYPGGENQPNLYIYVPMDPAICSPEYRAKLVPEHAVRYSRR